MTRHTLALTTTLFTVALGGGCGSLTKAVDETDTRQPLAGPILPAPTVVANGLHACTVVNGGLRCWGDNSYGQLGLGTTVPSGSCKADPTTGRAAYCDMAVPVPGLSSGVRSVSLGYYHTCALLTDDTVRCWGDHTSGAVGSGDGPAPGCGPMGPHTICTSPVLVATLPPTRAVAAGFRHNCALLTDGTVRCWGSDVRGQLGNGDRMPSQCHTSTDGFIHCTSPVLTNLGGVQQVTVGAQHSCALLVGGGLRCWGDNDYGTLGLGFAPPPSPDCEPWANRTWYCKSPVAVPSLPALESVAAGAIHNCALAAGTHEVRCWGGNYELSVFMADTSMLYGALPIGNTKPAGCTDTLSKGAQGPDGIADICWSPILIPNLTGTTALSAGNATSCFRQPSGELRCSGAHMWGTLGVGTMPAGCAGQGPGRAYCSAATSVLPSVTSFSSGWNHSCAITPNATQCWGMDLNGALGLAGSNPAGCAYTPWGAHYCTSPSIVLGL